MRAGLNPLYHYVTFGRNEGRTYSQEDKNRYLKENGGIFKPIYFIDDNKVVENQNLSRQIIDRIKQIIAVNDLNFNTKLKEFVDSLNTLPNFYVQVDYNNQAGYDKGTEYERERTARCGSDNFNAFQTRARNNFFECVDNDFNPNYARKYWTIKASELQFNWLKNKESVLQSLIKENITKDTVKQAEQSDEDAKKFLEESEKEAKINWIAVAIAIAIIGTIIYYFTNK